MIKKVSPITGHVARLCMNGILRVRIMWTINVCDNKPSHKPSGLKQCLVFGAVAAKYVPHDQIRDNIKDRTDGTYINHKTT